MASSHDEDNLVPSTSTASVASVSTVSEDDSSNSSSWWRFRNPFTLEPAVMLIFFAWNVSSAVFTDQIVFQVCTAELGYNRSDCLLLGTDNDSAVVAKLESLVQPYVSDLIMVKSIVETIIPAFLSLFIGSWSDKYGRRPILLAALSGFFLAYLTISILCAVSRYATINPWYYVLASIPVALSGGTCTLITGIFCYIADVTTEKDRAIKMGIVEAALFCGLLIGSGSSSYIYAWTSASFIFALSTTAIFCAFVYVWFCIRESKTVNELQAASKVRDLFRLELVKEMFAVCFRRRANHERAIIWMIMFSLGLSIFIMEGNSTVYFLFVRERLHWTVKEYTLYGTTGTIMLIVGNVIAMYGIKKYFGISEIVFALLAFASCLLDSIMSAIAFRGWHLYLAIFLTLFKGLVSPMCRSILADASNTSNVGSENEIGKIYTLTTSIEALTPIAAAPLYTFVYKATLNSYPGAFNIISASIYLIIILLLLKVYEFQRRYRTPSYTNMVTS